MITVTAFVVTIYRDHPMSTAIVDNSEPRLLRISIRIYKYKYILYIFIYFSITSIISVIIVVIFLLRRFMVMIMRGLQEGLPRAPGGVHVRLALGRAQAEFRRD